jgi:hypothetical protein
MPDAAESTESELRFKPAMDRANVVRSADTYSLSVFAEDARAFQAEHSAEAEHTHWTARIGIVGLALVVVFSFVSIAADTTMLAGLSLAGIFAGMAFFGLANRLAYLTGERAWIGPEASARLAICCTFLGLTAAVAGLTS